jgi:tripartite-type tricarboxylate transporter receptor subunit TctC
MSGQSRPHGCAASLPRVSPPQRSGASWPMARVALVALCALAAPLASAPAQAQSPEEFFKGKNVSLLIPFDAGSGYDTYGRAVARNIGRHIPGQPTIVASNMLGGGGLVMANHLFNVAPKDGTTIALFSRENAAEPLLGNTAARFDPRQFGWIGNVSDEVSICAAWHTAGFSSFEDLRKKEFVAASSGAGAGNNIYPLLFNSILGTKFKVVIGYKGGPEMNTAMERREADGRCGWSWTSIKTTQSSWLTDKKIVLLMQGALKKSKELPDVPLAIDLATKPEDRQALVFAFAPQAIAWSIVAPPGLPADRLAALRKAFMETMQDATFLAEAKRLKLDVNPMPAEEVAGVINDMYAAPPAAVAKVRDIMRPASK